MSAIEDKIAALIAKQGLDKPAANMEEEPCEQAGESPDTTGAAQKNKKKARLLRKISLAVRRCFAPEAYVMLIT